MNITHLTALAAGVSGHPAAGLVAFQAASGLAFEPEPHRVTLRARLAERVRTRRAAAAAAAHPAPSATVVPLPVTVTNRATRDNSAAPVAHPASAGAGHR